MNQRPHSGRDSHRCRAALIVIVLLPTILGVLAIRLAQGFSYTSQPILHYRVYDDAGASFPFGPPEKTTKELSSLVSGTFQSAKVSCLVPFRPPISPSRAGSLNSALGSPVRSKRVLSLRAEPSGDPNDPH
jgi:hypothetical protein